MSVIEGTGFHPFVVPVCRDGGNVPWPVFVTGPFLCDLLPTARDIAFAAYLFAQKIDKIAVNLADMV